MATRPVFRPIATAPFVESLPISFRWHPGFAQSQKEKSIADLHEAAASSGIQPILEVSSRSSEPLGVALSAFNLKVYVPSIGTIPLESAFQGSKVYDAFGCCSDLYRVDPRTAKHAARERDRGDLIRFDFDGESWDLEPKTAFYDWLYLKALRESIGFHVTELTHFAGFTDIEFNPERSFNCQARSCALAVSLVQTGLFERAMSSKQAYLNAISGDSMRAESESAAQARLF